MGEQAKKEDSEESRKNNSIIILFEKIDSMGEFASKKDSISFFHFENSKTAVYHGAHPLNKAFYCVARLDSITRKISFYLFTQAAL